LDIVLEHDAGSASENGVQETGQAQITELTDQMAGIGMDLPTNAAGAQSSTHTISRVRSVVSAIRRRFGNPQPQ